jgi:hypothetical protein
MIPSGVKITAKPAWSSALPQGVVPKKRRRAIPATSGGRVSGRVRARVVIRFPKKWYRARAYATGTATAMQIIVDITLVTRLSRIANRISGLSRLAISEGTGEYKTRPMRITLIIKKMM